MAAPPEENPPLPPFDAPPTPSGGMRRPMASAVLLERALSNSEMRPTTPEEEQAIITSERQKEVEVTVGETFDVVNGLRGEVHGFKQEIQKSFDDRIATLRDEILARIGPIERRVLGLAGLAAVAAAVGGALINYFLLHK